MTELRILSRQHIGWDFLPANLLPDGQDEFYLRNRQVGLPDTHWRALDGGEIRLLEDNGSRCDDWSNVRVHDPFDASLVMRCRFFGLVRIGALRPVSLRHHEIEVPVGLVDSCLVSCDVGDDCAIDGCRYLAHAVVGDNAILRNLGEVATTPFARFGHGSPKVGHGPDEPHWIDVANEAGGRGVLAFAGMTVGDAWLWSQYRDDRELQRRLVELAGRAEDPGGGAYSQIGAGCVIKNVRCLKDVRIGAFAYVSGADKIKNVTILSTPDEPTRIGEGVELIDGIVSAGCCVRSGSKATRFVLGTRANLLHGARIFHTVLGDNSTISCCEAISNLIFPAHEQHHNNSFLIACIVGGQSNVGAGATIGSNHNSRSPDGEIVAGRGFWPGLCVSLKHNSRFASFTLLAKGSYPAELDVPLPFTLVADDEHDDRLWLLPAYWWQYNMYALMRNSWKFHARDRRLNPRQHVEFDALAPDTAEEIFAALRLLEIWTAKARIHQTGEAIRDLDPDELADQGRALLEGEDYETADLVVLAEGVEHSHRPVQVRKPRAAWRAYRQMLHHYAMRTLVGWLKDHPQAGRAELSERFAEPRLTGWVNMGGQIVAEPDLDALRDGIREGRIETWDEVHAACDEWWARYGEDKARHAYGTLLALLGVDVLSADAWADALDQAVAIQHEITEKTYVSREKDYSNPFRSITYRNAQEMYAVLGSADDNTFIQQVRDETDAFDRQVREICRREKPEARSQEPE